MARRKRRQKITTSEPIRQEQQIKNIRRRLYPYARDYLLFVFGTSTALRISDILDVKIELVTDKRRRIKSSFWVIEGKTQKSRKVELTRLTKAAIRRYLKHRGDYDRSEYLFDSRQRNKQGEYKLSRQQAHLIIKRAGEAEGLEHISPHSMRKTYGYHLYKAGVELAVLMAIFNHDSEEETLKYIGMLQDEIRKSVHAPKIF